jgi:hypothetical protein
MSEQTTGPAADEAQNQESIGGWISDAGRGFDNTRDFREVADFTALDLNPAHKAYFRKYLDEYFQGPCIFGGGTEDILENIYRAGEVGRWLDLGAGTSSLLWSIPMRGIASVACCDLVPEALAVLDDFVKGDEIPRCYADVMEMYGVSERDLRAKRGLFGRYLVFDTFQPWPAALGGETFDFMTAVGNFGLSPTADGYKACFTKLSAHLAPAGTVVGADWTRSRAFIEEEGHDNSYVCPDLTREAAARAGFAVNFCEARTIKDDPLYDSIVVWSVTR